MTEISAPSGLVVDPSFLPLELNVSNRQNDQEQHDGLSRSVTKCRIAERLDEDIIDEQLRGAARTAAGHDVHKIK
ncbi:hypothetical protein D3C73_1541880 [compost metagenome]